jgi:hypothetical protein
MNEDIDYGDFKTIKEKIDRELGFSVNILYSASQDCDESKRQNNYIFVLERGDFVT